MCRVKHRFVPCVRGKWRGSLPRRIHVSVHGRLPPGPAVIHLPISLEGNAPNLKGSASATSITDDKPGLLLLPKKSRSRKCFITRLPMEILLQVTEYLVPTGSSFHVFPTTRTRYGGARSTCLHMFCEQSSEPQDRVVDGRIIPIKRHLTALAQTCRVLSEAFCATMYGSNYFIFELSSHEVYPSIEGHCPLPVESWTKVLRGKRSAMWPLTKRTIQYVKHLTILGSLSWKEDELAKNALREKIVVTVRLLKLAIQLKSLTVDLRSGLIAPSPKSPPSFSTVGPNGRLGWSVQGPADTVLRLREPITSDEHHGMEEFWEMFEDLRGIRDIVLSGHVNVQMAEDLRAKMMSERASPVAAKAASKPQANSLKRRKGDESQRPLKSRRKA